MCSVITHRYGRDGRDSKKFEDKCLIFDFEFLQSISDPAFVREYNKCLSTFIALLNDNMKTGAVHNKRIKINKKE